MTNKQTPYTSWFTSNISTNPFIQEELMLIPIRHFVLKLSKYILQLTNDKILCYFPWRKRSFCTSYLCSEEEQSSNTKFGKIFIFLWFCHILVHQMRKTRKEWLCVYFNYFLELRSSTHLIRNKDYSFCKYGSMQENKLPLSEILLYDKN